MYCFLIQGPIYESCINPLINMTKNMTNVIISTWDDIPNKYIELLKNNKIEIVINKKPDYNGIQNVNYANISICNGIKRAKELLYTHVLRFRSDLVLNNVNKMCDICINLSSNKFHNK